MNSPRTIISRVFLGLSLCAVIAVFSLSSAGQDVMREARGLFSPAVAESAVRPSDSPDFVKALESEIYLPEAEAPGAGMTVSEREAAPAQELTAMLDGPSTQCSIQAHAMGQSGCI